MNSALMLLVIMASSGMLFALILKMALLKSKQIEMLEKENDIEIVVPFRNEGQNLLRLLQDLKAENLLENTWWIDDASNYQGSHLLLENGVRPDRLVRLPEHRGKKAAISAGVDRCEGEYVLTLDADVRLNLGYGKAILHSSLKDLNILPVHMNGGSFWADFFAWDFAFQWDFGKAIASLIRPITASGANLCFRRAAFKEVSSKRNDYSLASGDDQFLLAAMRNAKKEIQVLDQEELAVITDAPLGLHSGLNQRARWLSKSGRVGDKLAGALGAFGLVYLLSFYGVILYGAFQFNPLFIVGFAFWLPLHELWMPTDLGLPTWKRYLFGFLQPIYVLALLAFVLSGRKSWDK